MPLQQLAEVAPLLAGRLWDLGGFSLLILALSGSGALGVLVGLRALPEGDSRAHGPVSKAAS